jgi:hypothetical protein
MSMSAFLKKKNADAHSTIEGHFARRRIETPAIQKLTPLTVAANSKASPAEALLFFLFADV